MRRLSQWAVSLLALGGLFHAAAAQAQQAPQGKHTGNPLDIVSAPTQGANQPSVQGGTIPPL
jgi:hypothetical protein